MPIILIPLITVLVNDFMKVVFNFLKTGNFKIALMFKSGGMPSGHTSFVGSVLTLVFLELGSSSIEFMIATVFGIIVMYDARGIRRKSGDHARIINILQNNGIKNGNEIEELDEVLGHTNLEVLVGLLFSIAFSFFLWKTGLFISSNI